MLSRFRNLAQSAFGLASSSASPSLSEPPTDDHTEQQDMVTTRGGRATESPAVVGNGSQRIVKDSASKRKLDEDVASPALAAKRRRQSGTNSQKTTLEDIFQGIVEKSSHADLESTPTQRELRDTPAKIPTKEDESAEEHTQAATPSVPRKRGASPMVVIPLQTKAAHQGSQPKVPIRTKVNSSHDDVPFEDEATPPTLENTISSKAAAPAPEEVIEISDDSGPDDESVDESEFLQNAVQDSEAEDSEHEEVVPTKELGNEFTTGKESTAPEADDKPQETSSTDPQAPLADTHPKRNQEADSDESSDDEAPEAVTTTSARQQAALARDAAQEARTKQLDAERLKRQARDKALKERSQQNLKAKAAVPSEAIKGESDEDDDEDEEDEEMEEGDGTSETYARGNGIPALLPTHLLATERPATPELVDEVSTSDIRKQERQNRHIKFLEKGEQRIKDVKRGPVNVRVLEQKNTFMAPKVNKDTRHHRETLMSRHDDKASKKRRNKPNSSAKVQRKPVSSGFLRR